MSGMYGTEQVPKGLEEDFLELELQEVWTLCDGCWELSSGVLEVLFTASQLSSPTSYGHRLSTAWGRDGVSL